MSTARDFSTVSPSAKALLLLKAQTDLPFARQAAALMWGDEAVETAQRETDGNEQARARRRHFELRARSLDEAIDALGATRLVELAAGLSFRGLHMVQHRDVFYLDTDLPAIASTKADLVQRLAPSSPTPGTLRVTPLDALDGQAFRIAINGLPDGPIAILHEGLLMYLAEPEKERLAASVREALLERGGAWITADIYVRSHAPVFREEGTKKFIEQHRVEENKFSDLGAAEQFFAMHGFSVTRRLTPEADPWGSRQTWVLSPKA